jgi:hypothetical protein
LLQKSEEQARIDSKPNKNQEPFSLLSSATLALEMPFSALDSYVQLAGLV